MRNKRRKSRWRNGTLPYKGKKRKEREKRKKYDELRNGSDNTDAEINLLANESRNLNESVSFGNNNNINYNMITATCSRSKSETYVENSSEYKRSFIKSSGQDSYKSNDTQSLEHKMFKRFKSDCYEESKNMNVICEILDELTSKIERTLGNQAERINQIDDNGIDVTNSSTCLTEENILQSSVPYCQKVNKIVSKSTSKINSEIEMIQESNTSKFDNDKLPQITSAEKDDDIINEDLQNDEVGLDKWLNALTRKKRIEDGKEITGYVQKDKGSEHKCTKSMKKESKSNEVYSKVEIKQDNEAENNDESEYESSLIELRDTLINEASFDDLCSGDFNNKSGNFQNITKINQDSWNSAVEDFNEMMTDLSIAHFELIADSVETLRNFINGFSCKENYSAKSNKDVASIY